VIVYPYYTEELDCNTQYRFHNLKKRYIGLMCPKCNKSTVIRFEYSATAEYLEDNKPKEYSVIDILPTITYICPHCNQEVSTDVLYDPNIVHIIEKLNNKGWATDCSCEGHVVIDEDVSYSNPYILFTHHKLKEVLDYIPLQGGWVYLPYDEFMFSIYWDDNMCTMFEHGQNSWIYPISTRMLYLDRWVECLPTIKNNKFTPDLITDEVKKNIEAHNFGKPLTEKDFSSVKYIYEK